MNSIKQVAGGAHYEGVKRLQKHPWVESLRARLSTEKNFSLDGLRGSATPFLLSLLSAKHKDPWVIVLRDEDDVDSFSAELKLWCQERDVHPYPFAPESLKGTEHSALLKQMKALRAFLEPDRAKGIWVTTIEALSSPCFSLGFIDRPVLHFESGQTWKMDELCQQLEARGFEREDKVEQRGDYAARGGIVDIYPRFASNPVRLEFFDDELETLREFSPITQRSLRSLTRFVLDDLDKESLSELKRDGELEDYLPENLLFWLEEPESMSLENEQLCSNKTALWLLDPKQDKKASWKKNAFRAVPKEDAEKNGDTIAIDLQQSDAEGFSIEEAGAFLKARQDSGVNVFLLSDYGSGLGLNKKEDLDCWRLEAAPIESFRLSALNVECYHESRLVHVSEAVEVSRQAQMNDFLDLNMGDYVVHEDYGIGQFLGLHSIERSGVMSDFLLLLFANQTKIYVCANQIHLVQRYIGRGEGTPELSRIGTKSWELKKTKARKAIDRIVMELVHRQAFRSGEVGFAFSQDTRDQREFERAFPYADTPCQSEAVRRIKADMELPKPMDHLLCGDVGFGKTEVAMRAAHKALLDHKQVAVLAPTTLLAEQHYRSFVHRFPKHLRSSIACISRFTSTKERREHLLRLACGEVMILIGTHRLLSDDIEFADLGLLILDEEQKFGVKQKEQLKKRYPRIDALSLSATPIPRTLHLSMLGIRSVSNLTIAPENRLAIRTYLRQFDAGIIAHAIRRELDRGGQTYFLHNRVEDIQEMRLFLAELFPKARIGVGHGQMPERGLSTVMEDFYDRKFDIFLATSIIASGIDMPTANTMIINDAHRFGLSELHQIRGRIGRYNIQAYAYLLLPSLKDLAPKSLRRLRAIEEHQELGSGFRIAMRDMEIRGVGNILGEEQHGQIADIGYELYTQYLSRAIDIALNKGVDELIETELSWPSGSTYFPHTYIPSHSDRIDFYRRISFCASLKQLELIETELRDRFGISPAPTKNLLSFFRSKLRLKSANIASLRNKDNFETALIKPYRWSDDLKLKWVLNHQKELAFKDEKHIVLRLDRIWKKNKGWDQAKDAYARYSYVNSDNRPDPLLLLDELTQFIFTTVEQARQDLTKA